MPDLLLPILGLRSAQVPDRVIVVGDPARARALSERLQDANNVANNREYLSFLGTFDGHRVLVVSHGVGAAGAAVCFEELFRADAKLVIRAGTAGALQDHIGDGSVVVATGAVRDEGVTHRLVPDTFPAVADPDVVIALRHSAEAADRPIHEGLFLTSDLFYPHKMLGNDLALWSDAGVIATEMEASALFVLASLHGRQAGSIAVTDGNPLRRDDQANTTYDPDRTVVTQGISAMLDIALHAVTHTDLS